MFDPTLPADHTKAIAAQMRGQLHGLKALLDALAAGTITAAVVDAVNTLPPGTPASVSVNASGDTLHFTFSIPQGNDGQPGPQGQQGSNGSDGQTGAQGEVSMAQMNTAITTALGDAAVAAAANSSAKSNSVATLDGPFSNDPPTMADMEVLRAKINEMLLALRR